jgi:hypothetical protein
MSAPSPDKPNFIELRVSVTDGSFDTTIRFPTIAPKAEVDTLTRAWLDLIDKAVKTTQAIQKEEK